MGLLYGRGLVIAVLIGAVLAAIGVWVFQGFWSPLPTMELLSW